jgi:hypothetical protein
MMLKVIFAGAACLAVGFGATSAYALGGWSPGFASPYAIWAPETIAPQATTEGRAAFVGDDSRVHCPTDKPCDRTTNKDDRDSSPPRP